MATDIRQIRQVDFESWYEALTTVIRERQYLAFLEPPPIEDSRAFVAKNIAKGYPQLVALDGERVAGWCDITPPGRDVMAHVGVLGIALLPVWRGRGLGERLMREALAAADAFGYLRVELSVFATNQRAASLYRKIGFVDEGVRRCRRLIDGVFTDEIMMGRLKPGIVAAASSNSHQG